MWHERELFSTTVKQAKLARQCPLVASMAIEIESSKLRRITNDFSDTQKVGGGYGDVYKAVYNGEAMAVKLLHATKGIDDKQFMKGLRNHMKVQHPNIVRLVGYCNEETKKYVELPDGTSVFGRHIYKVLCFEYMVGRSLDKRLPVIDRAKIWCQQKGTCEGLFYLHNGCENRILHLDLKPANVLLDKSMKPKIADLDCQGSTLQAVAISKLIQFQGQRENNMPPESIHGSEMSDKTDVYGLGVTIIEVCAYWRKRDSTTNLYQVDLYIISIVKFPCVHYVAIICVLSPLGRDPLDVVIVYAFECTESTPAWYTVDNGIFWLLQEKLTHFPESCIGCIYIDMTPNTYTSDMKVVDPNEMKETGYTRFAWHRMTCTKNMASGLADAHKMISNHGHHNGIILFFSDGLINKGDFFDGTENFISKVHVHTFTLGGDAYNHVLHSIATNSPGGKFHTSPVPERPNLSTSFSKLLDNLLGRTREDDERPVSSISGRETLYVVIVYAFDSTESAPTWYTVDNGIFWLLQEKLTHYPESCMGYIYVDMTPNTYTSDMKVVDPNEMKETGYMRFAWRRMTCSKNMASGLADTHKVISNRGHHNGIILFFSDGSINKGDFFDGTENFVSKVPVHTFTLGGDAYNHVLHSIATFSPGGKFHTSPVPERPNLSTSFTKLLDNLLGGREQLDVVILYAFDCTESIAAWYTVDNGIFWLLQEKLTHFPESCMGYIYVDMTPNTYTSDMKVVDPNEMKETGYMRFAWRRMTCTTAGTTMASYCSISDGLINKGNFFDGTENFASKVPAHSFTLGGDAYNNVLHSIATNSPGGKFHTSPVPERPNLSTSFSKLLDNLLGGTPEVDERPISSVSGREPLDVVIVYAFDCTESTPAWYTVDNGIVWLLQEKLTHFPESCMGYIYVDLTPNTYTSDMKVVDPNETMTCTKNMASGLADTHKIISNHGHHNGIILFFSDGLINKGDFFDGTENFVSKVHVHTFTLGGDAYNHVLHSIATNSLGGKFHTSPVPERPNLSTSFSKLLDSLLGGTLEDDERPVSSILGREPLDVVIVYAFDCTDSTPKLTHFPDSCMGYVYVDVTPNTYTSGMKVVDPAETKETGYMGFARHRMTCGKKMASGLAEAHKMLKNRDYHNGIILFFSDELINKGDFFDGTDNFISKVPVHTFTVGGDTYNHGLQAIATNSPGGTFNAIPVPERPHLSVPFSKLLDSLLSGTMEDRNHQ
ncbi:hypothetical protein VPH35_132605 [Triticum aestivum]